MEQVPWYMYVESECMKKVKEITYSTNVSHKKALSNVENYIRIRLCDIAAAFAA